VTERDGQWRGKGNWEEESKSTVMPVPNQQQPTLVLLIPNQQIRIVGTISQLRFWDSEKTDLLNT